MIIQRRTAEGGVRFVEQDYVDRLIGGGAIARSHDADVVEAEADQRQQRTGSRPTSSGNWLHTASICGNSSCSPV
jgi:hypothetical protein